MTFNSAGKRKGTVVPKYNAALLPRRGPDRLAALDALEAALVADTSATLDAMVASGWPVESALDAHRDWLHRLIDAAVDEGLAEWCWEAA